MKFEPPITSRTNARVKALRASFGGKSEWIGLEGEHLLAEATRSGLELDTVFLREGSEGVLHRPALRGLKAKHWVVLSAEVFESAVDTGSPQGIAATLAVPKFAELPISDTMLMLEDVQDPGNLGTLIRSAEAFGIKQVFVTPATVNEWNPKVIRASAGSVFRVPVVRLRLKELSVRLQHVVRAAAVVKSEGAVASPQAVLGGDCVLMIGNEGAGLSHEALALSTVRVHIPCAVESLNAAIAGSLLMYEAMRQRGER